MNENVFKDINLEDINGVAGDGKGEDVIGVVTDCLELNIRKEAFTDADIVAVVSALSELCVDLESSTDEWYSVCTVSGIMGFCMKKFVAIKE